MKTEVSVKNMFSAACYQFVKSVGRHTLHPVPSIDESDNIKPFQLVIKSTKRRFIWFEKAHYHPTEFQFTDILTDMSPLPTKPVCETLITDYNRTTKLSLKGKFGADISKEIIDIELEASDSITIDIKFGRVTKTEVREPELMSVLNDRSINLDHPLVRQIREDKSKVLCIITAVSQLGNGGTIHRETEVDASTTLKASVIKEATISGETTYDKNRNIVLPAHTPVAYSLHELNVDKNNGNIQLVLAQGCHGGFRESIGYDEVDATSVDTDAPDAGLQNRKQLDLDLRHPSEIFLPLLQLPEQQRREITEHLLYMLSIPRDLNILADMIERTEHHQQNKMKLTDIEDKLISEKERWLQILTFAGYTLENGELIQPLSDPPVLQCIGEFLDAATTLDDDVLQLITNCPRDIAEPLLTVHNLKTANRTGMELRTVIESNERKWKMQLQEGFKGKSIHNTEIVQPLVTNEAATKLLLELQYRVQDTEIQAPVELTYSIDEVYWIIYALWGKE